METMKRRDHMGDLDVDESMILNWNLEKLAVRLRNGIEWLRIWSRVGSIEQGLKPLEVGNFLAR
jgi:hypothetical protein